MIDIKILRENPNLVKEALKKRNVELDLDEIIELDKKRRLLQQEIDNLRHSQKQEKDISKAKEIKEKIKTLEKEAKEIEKKFEEKFRLIPNIPFESVPVGKDEEDNVVLREVGAKRDFSFKPKDYLEVVGGFDYIDTERAAKVSGSRFGYLKGKVAFLELALINFVFAHLASEKFIKETAKKNNLETPSKTFKSVFPPVMIKPEMMAKMGYMDRHSEEIYFLRDDDLVLVGTSEQSIGPMYANEILEESDLPLRYVAFSNCFRREAGSYGKDTKGILRVHQFDKIEMFSFVQPEKSDQEHKLFLAIEEELMQLLELPYRVVHLCTGDIGDPSAQTFDIETWLPGQNDGNGQYRETHSTSNCTDFQSRRLNIRYRDPKTRKVKGFVHTINGTAFAIGRIIIAIIENYQKENGNFDFPEVLKEYLPIVEEK